MSRQQPPAPRSGPGGGSRRPLRRDRDREPLRPADLENPGRTDTRPAGLVLAIMVGALLVGAVLNAQALLDDARGKPLGTGRTVSVAIWTPVARVAAALGLDRPRDAAEAALGRGGDGPTVTITIPPAGEPTAGSPVGTPPTGGAGDGDGPADGAAPEPGDGPDAGPADGEAPADGSAPTEPAQPAGPPPLPPASAEDPLRVLLVGDSTMTQLAGAFTRQLAATGIAETEQDARPATGFSRPDFFDWPSRLAQLVAEDSTDLTIAMFGANDAQGFEHEGQVHDFGSEGWVRIYRARVATAMDLLTSTGDPVIWIGQPAMRSGSFDDKMRVIDQIVRSEAEARPAIRYVDARSILAGPDGGFAEYRTGDDGQRTRIRDGDGIHFTTPGTDVLASAVLEPVLAELAAGP